MSHRLLLGGIVVVAILVRVAGLGDRLSADEGYTWLAASAGSWGGLLDRLAAFENTPPLYYLLLAPLPLGDEAWLRLPALLAGVAAVPVLYWAVRPLAGRRAALLAALGLAVAPYAVSFSNYARGFTLADLGLLVALAAVVRLALGASGRWWWAYAAGAVVALYSEYDSALFLAALVAALLATRARPAREVLVRGALPALALLPWLPELGRGLDAIDETKASPVYPGLSPASLRDVTAALTFGEHGSANAAGLRWLQALAVVGGLAAAARLAQGSGPRAQPHKGLTLVLLGGTAVGTFVLHALAAAVGPDVFHQRYLTELVPLGIAIGAIGLERVPRLVPVAAVALVVLGTAVFVQRHERELEPDVAALAPVLQQAGDRVVLTNSAVVAYYLRQLDVRLDRPFGLGQGLEADCAGRCGVSFAVVDDTRVAGGARPGPGPARAFGPLVVRLTPKEALASGVSQGDGAQVNSLACSFALLLAASLGPAPAPHALEVTVQDDALMLHQPPAEVGRTARRIAALGGDIVRITAGWSALAPQPRSRRRPAFDARKSDQYPPGGFRQLDTAVKAARAAGLKVQLDVGFWAPRWAVKRGVRDRNRQRWQPDVSEYGQFAAAVAERYSGGFPDPDRRGKSLPAVRDWATWNEPNHPSFLLPQWERRAGRLRPAAPHIYRRMHEAAYDALKRVSKDNRVMVGGLSSRESRLAGATRNLPPMKFMREMACVDDRLEPLRDPACDGFKPIKADGFAYHPYTFEGAPDAVYGSPDTVHLADINRLAGLLGALRERGRIAGELPIHVTEYGYETNPPDPFRGVDPETQARYHGLATWTAWRQPEVRSFAQFLLRDLGPDSRFASSARKRWISYQTGLEYHDGADKPALQAFKLPFWAEARGPTGQSYVLAFGQVRPFKGPQRVELEVQGADGVWRSVDSLAAREPSDGACGRQTTEFLTDADGFYLRVVPYEGTAAYRPRWVKDDGHTEYGVPVTVGAPKS